eukprot:CAMPEP_0179448094 /NCGR_PEP_ID=MMETSP0799-20121207/31902_1 /TAXON_ID=46947 /ORGANISM="Geminigera cryophila, Strain CCMP2564" /LENGTH=59 /DNA_ID=CAMNT_0021239517 /DNA_START=203 /DNA_END=382 /DNA_ORIENTATION=+
MPAGSGGVDSIQPSHMLAASVHAFADNATLASDAGSEMSIVSGPRYSKSSPVALGLHAP